MTLNNTKVINLNLKKDKSILDFKDFQKQEISFDITKLQEAYNQIVQIKKFEDAGVTHFGAISLTQNPVLGYGWDLTDPTISVRRYDQDRKVYPQDISGEVHGDGEIIAGAFWDTYLNLGNMQHMLELFKYTYDGAPDGPNGTEGTVYTDVLIEVLYADDNDANITNGTPNDIDIIDAAPNLQAAD